MSGSGASVRTIRVRDAGRGWPWRNEVNGRVLSRHRTREAALSAGREIARTLQVEHVVDDGAECSGDVATEQFRG